MLKLKAYFRTLFLLAIFINAVNYYNYRFKELMWSTNEHYNNNDADNVDFNNIVEVPVERRRFKFQVNSTEKKMEACPKLPPGLGRVSIKDSSITLSTVETKYPEVWQGGWYKPPDCVPRDKVAILVPYRYRENHLAVFLDHMHPFLMKQKIEYGIFIIEQQGNYLFNRAKLFNVGFRESNRLKKGGWNCFVFHDVDLLPLDERNLYNCPRQPRHMSSAINTYKNNVSDEEGLHKLLVRFIDVFNAIRSINFGTCTGDNQPLHHVSHVMPYSQDLTYPRLPYWDIFGGVSAMTYEQFIRVNGFSNRYWGWGGEDDDISFRLRRSGYRISRYKISIGIYSMLYHKASLRDPNRCVYAKENKEDYRRDGLSNLKYRLLGVVRYNVYTKVVVKIEDE